MNTTEQNRSRTGRGRVAGLALTAALLIPLLACGSGTTSPAVGITIVGTAPSGTPPTPTATPFPLPHLGVHQVWMPGGGFTGPTESLTATCDPGEIALGGGWELPAGGVHVFAALASSNTWTVSAIQTGPIVEALQFNVYGECLQGARQTDVTRQRLMETIPPTPSAPALYETTCGAGAVPVGFGFDLSAASANLDFVGSWPFAYLGQWYFSMWNHDSVAHPISLEVQCLSGRWTNWAPGVTAVDVAASYPGSREGPYPAGDVYALVKAPSCPSGAMVAGGGFNYEGGGGSGEAYGTAEVDDLYAFPDHWQGGVYVVTAGPHGVYTNGWTTCLTFSIQ